VELRQYLAILQRRAAFIALAFAVGLAVAWVSTPRAARYSAQSVIYVGARQLASPNQDIRSDPITAAERLTHTFAVMIDSIPVAQAALETTGVQRSAGAVVGATSVEAEADTQLLLVTVTDPSPTVARDLANGMAQAFVEKVQQYEPGAPAAPGDVPSLPAYVFSTASMPVRPQPTDLRRNLFVGGLFGLVAAAGVVLLLEYLDVTIRNAADAERRLELPVLGSVPLERLTPSEFASRLVRPGSAAPSLRA
jgi:receptor protein-tyrosine kinase